MNRIKWKLQSRKGASITFSLLIFLVCAVVSSIVIVAASTSAGRLSEMAQMDQRYYAVTSAAEMLSDLFVKHERVAVSIVTDEETGTVMLSPVEDDFNSDFVQVVSKDLVELLLDKDSINPEKIYDNLNLGSESGSWSTLNCIVKATVRKSGMVELDISNDTASSGSLEKYTLRVTLVSTVQRVLTGDEYDDEQVLVRWKLYSIKKIYAES